MKKVPRKITIKKQNLYGGLKKRIDPPNIDVALKVNEIIDYLHLLENRKLESASESCDCGRKQHSLHWGCYANLMKPDTKAQDWEKDLGEVVNKYYNSVTLIDRLKDFISNAIEEERKRVLKEVNDQYVDMFGFDEDLDKYLGKIIEELETNK